MKLKLIILAVALCAIVTFAYAKVQIVGPGLITPNRATVFTFENYQVSDGVGGWENYQVSDGVGGWENYQVKQ